MDLVWLLPVAALAIGGLVVGGLVATVGAEARRTSDAVGRALAEITDMDVQIARVAPHLEALSRIGLGRSMARRLRRRAVPSTS